MVVVAGVFAGVVNAFNVIGEVLVSLRTASMPGRDGIRKDERGKSSKRDNREIGYLFDCARYSTLTLPVQRKNLGPRTVQ